MHTYSTISIGITGILLIVTSFILKPNEYFLSKIVFKVLPFFFGLNLLFISLLLSGLIVATNR